MITAVLPDLWLLWNFISSRSKTEINSNWTPCFLFVYRAVHAAYLFASERTIYFGENCYNPFSYISGTKSNLRVTLSFDHSSFKLCGLLLFWNNVVQCQDPITVFVMKIRHQRFQATYTEFSFRWDTAMWRLFWFSVIWLAIPFVLIFEELGQSKSEA